MKQRRIRIRSIRPSLFDAAFQDRGIIFDEGTLNIAVQIHFLNLFDLIRAHDLTVNETMPQRIARKIDFFQVLQYLIDCAITNGMADRGHIELGCQLH